jgi:AcrR family transcriptional regulator
LNNVYFLLRTLGNMRIVHGMARRSDHNRMELRTLILSEAHAHMREVGFSRFSAREVAKRVGYSIGTLYNVYGSLDRLFVAVNTLTFDLWADAVEHALAEASGDPVATLVEAYFAFARENLNLWNSIYDHHLPEGMDLEPHDDETRARLTGAVAQVVASALPESRRDAAVSLTRSLVATVHGHCAMELSGSYALMGSADAEGDALARVREVISYGRES